MYRNISYNGKNKECIILGWDNDGKQIKYNIPYKPYIYLITNNPNNIDAYSIYNEPLVKKEFETQSERYRFLSNHDYPRIYHNLDCQQQCLVDLFWKENEKDEFSKNLLNIGFFDIETYSPNGFPYPKEANDEINAITIYSTYTKKYYVFGCKPYINKDDDVEFFQCENEKILLKKFIDIINEKGIDVLAAWNGEGFDFPYICNRIGKICGEEYLKKLSPLSDEVWKPYSMREVIGTRGEALQKWSFEGLSLIDYMLVYKKYTYADRPSFALNYIANAELGEQKVAYGNYNLFELADNDWQKFIDYNIQDVRLLVKLDEKLKFINLLKLQAYAGLTTLEKAMGTISVTLGALAVRCKSKNKILHTKVKLGGEMVFEGGYVMEPVKGFHDDIVSFDANSLYPNTSISLNISPETKLGKIIQEDDEFIWFKSNKDGKIIKADKKKFLKKCKDNQIAVAKSGVLFSQNQVGILADYMDYYYKKRVGTKKQLKEAYKKLDKAKDEKEKAEIKERIEYLDLLQLALKIQINAAYGFFGTPFCPLGDTDITSSITKSGQAVVQQAGIIAWNYMKEHGIDYDPRVYMDTDSCIGSTQIVVNNKKISIENYYNQCNGNLIKNDIINENYIKEIIDNDKSLSYDIKNYKIVNNKIKYIKKHKVKKELFKISYKNKEVIITEDHSIIVKRNDKIIEVTPKEIINNDEIIIIKNIIDIQTIKDFIIDSLGIQEEYVYDIEVEYTHNFFANDILIHNSNYLTFHKLFEHLNIKPYDNDYNITKEALDVIEDYENYLNKQITLYAQNEYNSKDSRFVFKREVIADKGFFITKKRYCVRVLDDEGKKVKKLKYKGIDIVRNTMPEKIKPMAKEWLECMVVERDRIKCNNILKKIFNNIKEMSVEDLSYTINCSNLEKYTIDNSNTFLKEEQNNLFNSEDKDFEVKLHCPYHIRAAHAYNVILKKLRLTDKYDLINSGDKVKIMYVEPNNKFGVKCIAYKNEWPEEFTKIFKIDYNKLYDKIIDSMATRFYDIVGWIATNPNETCHTDLFDFLS